MVRSGSLSGLVAVDGRNLINDIGRYMSRRPTATTADLELAKEYYRQWFDIDRLVEATLADQVLPWSDLGIVVFRSRKAVGAGAYQMKDEVAQAFWARQGSNPNTSSLLVDVDGARAGKDVGMDIAIVVYLFETIARWDAVILFSNDSDFVPAVWSLRRQGKRVFCASDTEDRATPLVQACQHFYPWNVRFLDADWAMWCALQPDGPLDRFLERQDVAGRSPRIYLDGEGLLISAPGSRWEGNQENAINELLRGSGLYGFPESNGLRVTAARTEVSPARPVEFGGALGQGVTRHHGRFSSSRWHGLVHSH
jgi:hypothetical protein